MNKGILIFAHNGPEVDYGTMSIIAGGLAKKHLGLPVSLVTDKWTIAWLKESNMYVKAQSVFDKIIEIEKPRTKNTRKLHDGFHSQVIPFVNSNRFSVWDISPYDQTLLIDSDYLIFSNRLNEYWNVDSSVMLGHSMNDITGERSGILDQRVSETGVHMFWATTVMFTKNEESRFFFKLVDFIKDNYVYYADLFRFNPKQYRNDIAFSIAKHMLNGFETRGENLPPILTLLDKDLIHSIDKNQLRVYLNDNMSEDHVVIASIKDLDVHVMNKQSIIRNAKEFLEIL